MTRDTQEPAQRTDEGAMRMRILFVILAAASWWTYQTYHASGAGGAAPLPPVSSAKDPAARTPEPEGLERLWAAAATDAEPALDPVVLCRMGSEADYVRLSVCQERGGLAAAEPSWARSD